jgi:hypothetical protein
MSVEPSPALGASPGARRLPDILAEVTVLLGQWYGDYTFVLIGYPPTGDARAEVRVPCPAGRPAAPPPEPPEDGSNADVILQTLDEADRPLTVVELAYKATGGEPTGAFRKALKKLVRAGRVAELHGTPRTYEAV